MNLTPEKIPACLTEQPNWVLWKVIERGGEPTKVPFQVNGDPAKSSESQTWESFSAVCQRFEQGGYSGIGYVLAETDPFCGIDLDGCRDPETKVVAEWARDIIRRFDSYTEVSPSGTGVKIFIRGCMPFGHRNKVKVEAEAVSSKTPGIEVYDNRRYFACTGWRVGGVSSDVETREEAMQWLAETYLPREQSMPQAQSWYAPEAVVERARRYLSKMPGAVSGQHGHDRTFRAACVLAKGFGLLLDQAMPLMREWGETCQPPWSERELRHKLEDAAKQSGEQNYLRNVRPEDWDRVVVPKYDMPAQTQRSEPVLTTLEDATRKYVESIKSGKSSLIELGLPDVDYALGGGVEPGEMVILAARPSHGKSAVALQCVHHMTAQGMPAVFISEEMSELAIGKRVLQFASDVPQEHWFTSLTSVDRDVNEHFKGRAPCLMFQSCGTTLRATDAVRKAIEVHQVKVAVVDYAQLLTSSGKTRYEQITATSIALRQLASETKLVVLVLCQLSREIEKRTKFVPQTSDLKDTGQLEQDADVILFLVWPHKINTSLPANEFQFFIGKNRNRPINVQSVQCRFHPSRQMFIPEKPKGTEWTGEGHTYDAFAEPS